LDQIVEGFLQAMLAGATDDFAVARTYLAEDIAAVWDPTASVTVYQSGEAPQVSQHGSQLGRVVLSVTQVGTVDASGRYAAQPPEVKTATLQLSQDQDSQWRISSLPDGTVIPEDVFQGDYVAVPIYFPSPDAQYLVPDRRMFPRKAAATAAVKQFLAGPPPYLTGAVGAVVPVGTRLSTDAVQVAGSVATVNFSNAMSRASESARATVLACLNATLTQLPEIHSVELQVDAAPLSVPPSSGLKVDPSAAGGPFYLGDGGVWRYESGSVRVLAGTDAASSWESLAVDHTMKRLAGLEQGQLRVLVGEDAAQAFTWNLPAPATAVPHFDRVGWLWVASGDVITAFSAEGEPKALGATWLQGQVVTALAASRDAARLALAIHNPEDGSSRMVVSGIVRADGAAPWRLTGPLELGPVPGSVTSLNWADAYTLAFLAAPSSGAAPAPTTLVVGGNLEHLKSPTDPPVFLASGRGPDQIYVTGKAGGLFSYAVRGRVWTALGSGARAVTLAP
jgi:hypothetical protein